MDVMQIMAVLSECPLLALVEEKARRRLAERMTVHAYDLGEKIYDRGDAGDAMFFVAAGRVRLVGLDTRGQEVTLSKLEPGGYFGETELLNDERRTASARASDRLVLLRLARDDFNAWLKDSPDIREVLTRCLEDSSLLGFLKQFTVLETVPAHALRGLIAEMEEVRLAAQEIIIREGEEGDRFFIVRKGVLNVVKDFDVAPRLLGQVGEGEFFGERALLTSEPRAATLVAETDCELFALRRSGFERAVAASPELKKRLLERMQQYEDVKNDRRGKQEAPVQEFIHPTTGDEEDAEAPKHVRPARWRRLLRAYPFVKQHDETDCGAACLAMIMRCQRVPVSVARMRDLANVDADGATMWSLAQAAENLGFRARGLLLSLEALRAIRLPAIVHWEGQHYIVLYAIGRRSVVVGDPADSLRGMSIGEFRRGWTGRALELIPGPQVGQEEKALSPRKRFWPIIRPFLPMLAETLGASLLLSLFGLGLPLFTQAVVDRVLASKNLTLLNMLFMGMLLISVLQALTGLLRRLLLAHISTHADARLVSDFLKHVFQLPMNFFNLRRVGDIVSRVSENEKIRNALVGTIPGAIMDASLTIIYLALMMAYNASLTLMAVGAIPLFVILILTFTPAIRRNRSEQFVCHSSAWSYLIESVTGMETVKSCAAEMPVRWRMDSLFVDSLLAGRRGARIETAYSSIAVFLESLASVTFLWFGARLVVRGELTAGQMLAFCALAGNVLMPIVRLVDAWDEMQDLRHAVARLNDIFGARPEEPANRALLRPSRLQGHIRFDQVTFSYTRGQDRPVLANLNLEIQPGQTIALVGRSGSGKSTIGKLLLGLYPPRSGRIIVDGHDLRTLSSPALRRRIGVVPQDVFLFSGTVRENIALGEPEAPLHRVVAVAKQAGAHEFIVRFPLGYDTRIGERGQTLSGGQRQRLALARALVSDPDILVLDEATSSLDTQTERAVQDSLERMQRRLTLLVIAHRLSTVRRADCIYVLDNGVIVESGTHEELLRRDGLYALLAGRRLAE